MKFRIKIALCMIGLVSVLFGIGESLLLKTSFDQAIDRERKELYGVYQMVSGTLQVVGDINGSLIYEDIAGAIFKISAQNEDLWEMIITFVISQQKTIPAIRSLVEALAKTYGQKLAIPKECRELPFSSDCRDVGCGFFYAFPTPEELARASLSELQSMKLGYRAKYIKRLCEDACSGALDLAHLSRLGYQDAMDYLQGFYGIGEKVANCICLFGLHHIGAFPVDTWIRKILLREYAPKSRCAESVPQTRLCQELVQENFSCYKGFAGVMQQYIFYYERSHS